MSRNPTGFDVKRFVAAANPNSIYAKKDPWARYEAWRYTGPFSRWNRFSRTLPGLGTAIVAFTAYCAYEEMFLKKDHHGHAEASEGHH